MVSGSETAQCTVLEGYTLSFQNRAVVIVFVYQTRTLRDSVLHIRLSVGKRYANKVRVFFLFFLVIVIKKKNSQILLMMWALVLFIHFVIVCHVIVIIREWGFRCCVPCCASDVKRALSVRGVGSVDPRLEGSVGCSRSNRILFVS